MIETKSPVAENKFAKLLTEYDYQQPKRGQFVEGEVVKIEDNIAFLDIGAKHDAIVPQKDLNQLEQKVLDGISIGDCLPVYVTATPEMDSALYVSIDKGLEQADWGRAKSFVESGEILQLKIVGQNRGGLLVAFGRLRGFVPNTLIPQLRRFSNPAQLRSAKEEKIGGTLLVQVIEVDHVRERLVLSAKEAHQPRRKQRLQELEAGQVIKGQVVNLVKFGAFVDIGGIEGLIHISKLSWQRVDHPSDTLDIGEEVEVLVEDIDIERERISLNRKALLPNPLASFANEHKEGDLVEGVVTNIRDFGAFVKLSEGVVGLIHISEMFLTGPSKNPADILFPEDKVLVKIVEIDVDRERVGLSIRRVSPEDQFTWILNSRNRAKE